MLITGQRGNANSRFGEPEIRGSTSNRVLGQKDTCFLSRRFLSLV